jgi:hypothetical protein
VNDDGFRRVEAHAFSMSTAMNATAMDSTAVVGPMRRFR